MVCAESVLAWGEEVIDAEVGIELLVDDPFCDFSYRRNDGYRPVVGSFGGPGILLDGMNECHLP